MTHVTGPRKEKRKTKVAAAEKRAGLIDGGLYRVPRGERAYRWFRVIVQFYPKEHWLVEEMDGGPIGSQSIPGTQRLLDDTLKSSFETRL